MRILVTGGEGQVAKAFVAQHSTSGTTGVIHNYKKHLLDIRNLVAIDRAVYEFNPDVVINCAAYTDVDGAEVGDGRDVAISTNHLAVERLARVCAQRDVRLIHLSTDYVFNGERGSPYSPSSYCDPINWYGRTKLNGEVAALAQHPTKTTILRTSTVYSANGKCFLNAILDKMRNEESFEVIEGQISSPTSAHCVARALWFLVKNPEITGTQHYTDSGVASKYDFACAIANEAYKVGLIDEESEFAVIQPTPHYTSIASRPAFSVLESSLEIPRPHWVEALRDVIREKV